MLMLGLHLATELCRGNEGDMGSAESGGFSCGGCTVGTMYHPFYCQHCYRATGGDDEEHSCKRCKFGPSKFKRFICNECNNTDQKPTTITPKSKCCKTIVVNKLLWTQASNITSAGFPVYVYCKGPVCKRDLLLIFNGTNWVQANRGGFLEKCGPRKWCVNNQKLANDVIYEYPEVGHICPDKIGDAQNYYLHHYCCTNAQKYCEYAHIGFIYI